MTDEYSPELTNRYMKLRAFMVASIMFTVVTALLSIAAMGYLVLRAGNQSEQNFDSLQTIKDINDRLLDCTEPSGECYQDGSKRTAQAIVGINEGTLKVIVAALTCQQRGIETEKALARCTARLAQSE